MGCLPQDPIIATLVSELKHEAPNGINNAYQTEYQVISAVKLISAFKDEAGDILLYLLVHITCTQFTELDQAPVYLC